jgi:integrase
MGSLTNLSVKNLKTPGRYHDGNNLILAVYPSGAKCWVLRYRHKGKRVELGLGGFPATSLQQARRKTHEARGILNDGRSPKTVWAEERRIAGLPTFEEASETFISSKGAEWTSDLHRDRVRSILMNHCGAINNKLVTEISTEDILNTIKTYMTQAPASAYRLRNVVEQILASAQALGHIPQGTPNPARWAGHLDRLLPEAPASKNFAAMPYADVPAFVHRLRGLWVGNDGRHNVAALALSYLILCGSRMGEAIEARWSEIDMDAKLWVIPGSRMKGKVEHQIPLSPSACEILSIMQGLRSSDFVFSGSRAGQPMDAKTVQRFLVALVGKGKFTVHGFRSGLKDWAADTTNFGDEVSEIALAHTVGSKVRRAYRRLKAQAKLRDLFEQWDRYLHASADNVVRLRTA